MMTGGATAAAGAATAAKAAAGSAAAPEGSCSSDKGCNAEENLSHLLNDSDMNFNVALAGEEEPERERHCDSLIMCIVTTLNEGLRNGGGIGDILRKPSSRVRCSNSI